MKKYIFLSFTAFAVVLLAGIFISQSGFVNTYFHKAVYEEMQVAMDELEAEQQKLGDNRLFVTELATYMVTSNNYALLLDDQLVLYEPLGIGHDYRDLTAAYLSDRFSFDTDIGDELREKGYVVFTMGMTGEDYLMTVRKLITGERLVLVSNISRARSVLNIYNDLLLRVVLISLVVGIIVIGIISQGISRSLLKVVERAKEVTQLKFDRREDVKGPAEVRLLNEAFNVLSETLDETIGDLNEANVQLQADIHLKEEQEALRKRFVSDVSHEFKTPVTIIKSYSEALMDGIGDREFYSRSIYDEAIRMDSLIEELVTLFKYESEVALTEKAVMDFSKTVSESVERIQPLAESNGLFLSAEIEEGINIYADISQISRAVKNLMMNAVIHSKDSAIEIKLKQLEEKAVFSVFNKADPIPEEQLTHLWHRFYKTNEARELESGSGLGLAIVKSIMENHDGEYSVVQQDGGLAFLLRFSVAAITNRHNQ